MWPDIKDIKHTIRKIEVWGEKGSGCRCFSEVGNLRSIRMNLPDDNDGDGAGSLMVREGSVGDMLAQDKLLLLVTVDYWEDNSAWNDYHIDHFWISNPRKGKYEDLNFDLSHEELTNIVESPFTLLEDYCNWISQEDYLEGERHPIVRLD